ncbi:hypothetical protein HDV05_006424 [Chytridiales sp. JEL 0842]|nr:hypothetical protein HDV05_006424 [Chytridiales sp. JEL 0842]
MKITKKIEKALAEDRCYWSFEYFPPKTEMGVTNLYDRMERMYNLGPEFIDVTWAAGGGSSELTLQICTTAQSVYGLETCMHLTCTNMPREKIDEALEEAKAAGIQNILALRGDPPRGQINWTKHETGFSHGADLVKYIKEKHGDYFCVGVAGYPEGHIENPDKDEDFKHFVEKAKGGADYVITQLFYDCDLYLEWLNKVRAAGVTIPIIPGMMPIQSFAGFKRMTDLCRTKVPQFILDDLEPIKNDDQAVKDYGVQLGIAMCKKLKAADIKGFHFYCLNLEKSVRLILEGLDFVAPVEVAKPLPWNPSLAKNREKENVRPIFWKNRTRSYILRTESWDEFPNGRWGDSRSPAYGDIDGYGISLKYTSEDALKMWGSPTTTEEVFETFAKFCRNEISALPWCDQPLQSESDMIVGPLAEINSRGYLTINSQPAVDGVPSSDRTFGWGPKNGFIYQKAYLEFFISPASLDKMIERIANQPFITFYAVNKQGDLKTNNVNDGPNAVTWGVFPAHEIIQPTVVDGVSFLAWKDEAFELWHRWSDIYPAGSKSSALINEIANTYYLVNDRSEQEYQEAIDLIDTLKVPHEEHHKLQWQVHRREAEVAELQQALSDAQTQLFDERKQLLRAIAENDELKVQELKDRRKIRYLLSTAGSTESEVTYFRDALDKRLVKIHNEKPVDSSSAAARKDKPDSQPRSSDRDIIILEDEIQSMKLTITALHTQLDEQRKSYEETIAGLKRDRRTLLDEERVRRENEATKSGELMDKLDKLRSLNRENIREILYLKKTLHQNERRLGEEKAHYAEQLLEMTTKYNDEKERMDHAEKVLELKLSKRHENTIVDLQQRLYKAEDDLRTTKQKLEAAEKSASKKTDYLTERIRTLTSRFLQILTFYRRRPNQLTSYNSLKRRRDYEIEGFTNDILMLRKQLRILEKSILKYGPLEDRELVLLSLARETGEKAARISSDLQGIKSKMIAAEQDLRSLKF